MSQDRDADLSASRSALRIALLILTSAQMLLIIGLTVFVSAHANQPGVSVEFVALGAAIMLLELPFTIPAFILAVRGKALGSAASLAGFATFAYVVLWIQVQAETAAKAAP